ncbi:MAG: NAD(P)H-binding protein [Rhodocyclaceae bacterium]|nr:NAD(P)H-binding protein [Rhodocyclaceae bacterium]
MIVVSGANGQLGRAIVEHLAAAGGTSGLGVSVRDTAKAEALAKQGIRVRHGDFDAPASLAESFAGAHTLVLVSTDGGREQRIGQHANAIAAAKAAGVRRIVYTSFLDAAGDSPAEFAAVHHQTEADLRTSGLELAILRNTLYADHLPMTVGGALASGVFHLPAGQGKFSLLSRNELAAAAAAAARADKLDKEIYQLTGSALYDYDDVAAALQQASAKPARYERVSEDDYAAALANYGVPAGLARALANMFTAVAQGRFAILSEDYARLTGRAPASLQQYVNQFVAA